MNTRIHLLFGGLTDDRDDYRTLKIAAKTKKTRDWSCLKETRAGDQVLVYCTHPHGAIVATAEAMKNAVPGREWKYVTTLRNVRLVDPPLSREQIRAAFPDWAWAKSTRGQTYVDSRTGKALWKMATASNGTPAQPEALKKGGAGFGDPESNSLVEKAAVDLVTAHLAKQGYKVVSREAEKVGYDLDATKGGKVLHVEVKGISGQSLQFPLTAAEARRAGKDTAFQLFAVTNARTRACKIHKFTGTELIEKFDLSPLTFLARKK